MAWQICWFQRFLIVVILLLCFRLFAPDVLSEFYSSIKRSAFTSSQPQ